MEYLQNVYLAHLQLLMNTSAKYKANWTESVVVVQTRFCGQTDRQADSSIPPPHFVCGGIKTLSSHHQLKKPIFVNSIPLL